MTAASPTPLDLDMLSRWIGREQDVEDTVTPELARRFHATFDLDGPPPGSGEPAPQLIHFCLGQPIDGTAQLGGDGHPPKGCFLPPVPLPHRMWAGGRLEFYRDLIVGERVRRTSRIADVSVKAGRNGQLCFVAVEHIVSVAGIVAIREHQNIVYREAGSASGSIPSGPAPAPLGQRAIHRQASSVLLFRYSALTFNSHRIHYDRPYATEVENHRGLVVHGPLQASLLLQFAISIRGGTRPNRFSFRSESPLYDGPFGMHADSADSLVKLWTAAPGGPIVTSALAEWQ